MDNTEFNLVVGSHMSITLWCELCRWGVWGKGGGEGVLSASAVSHSPLILLYITSRFAYIKHLFWQLILIFLYFKLGLQTHHPLAWMFFRTLATAFPASYRMRTVCSRRVWKLSNDACPLNLIPQCFFPNAERLIGEESQSVATHVAFSCSLKQQACLVS